MTPSRTFLLGLSAFVGISAASAQVMTPLTLTGYNADGIANGTYTAATSVTGSISGTTGLDGTTNGNVLYQVGFNPDHATYGVPSDTNSIATFTSRANANTTFAIQPSAGNNLLFLQAGVLGSANATGTLTLGTARAYNNLAFLVQGYGIGSSSGITTTYQLNFSNGTNTGALSFTAYDWFNTTNVASGGLDRVSTAGTFGNSNTNPVFHEVDVTVAAQYQGLAIASITFVDTNTTANNNVGIFGVSAAVPEPATWAGGLATAACLLGGARRFRRALQA